MSVAPGSSYQASNAHVRLKRHALSLEDPVRIKFKQEWKAGNPLYEWYRRRSSGLIKTMQLRKETKAPFFHEYVVFELEDNGGYFRIDRRQLPEENMPLDCIYEYGVEAFDTIEQVVSLEDETYSASDCLATLNFSTIQLELVLWATWAIHQNKRSRVYTLQRYNCYFFAQTVFLFAARSICTFYDRPQSGSEPSRVDWLVAYPHLQAPHEERCYDPDVETPKYNASTLPRTLRYVFQQLSKRDHGVHALSTAHLGYCPLCLGMSIRTSSSKSTMTFNASSRVSPVGGSIETHPGPSTEEFLSSFCWTAVKFWRCALSDALAAHKVEFDASRIEYGLDAYQSEEEVKQRIFQAVDQILAPNSSATRVLWSKCVREALQQFSAGLGSGMRRISACPVQEPDLISDVNVEMTGDAKWMEDWMGCLAAFLDSEYDRLERALKAEIASNIWVGDKKAGIPPTISAPISSAFVLTTNNTLRFKPTTTVGSVWQQLRRLQWLQWLQWLQRLRQWQQWRQWRQFERFERLKRLKQLEWLEQLEQLERLEQSKMSGLSKLSEWWKQEIPRELYGYAAIYGLDTYLDRLTQAHGDRVEQYKTWLKCTSYEVSSGVRNTREAIWDTIKPGSERAKWGLWIDPNEFSLNKIN